MATEETNTRFRNEDRWTEQERTYLSELENYITTSVGSNVEKFSNFSKYTPRQNLTRFLSRYEIFKRVLHVQGSVIECGLLFGGGLMEYAQLSAILEPANFQRMIIGFDTFSGFPELHAVDRDGRSPDSHPGGLAVDSYDDLQEAIRLYDANRPQGHMSRVKLVRGDVRNTVPAFLEDNPHLIVSLLYLDMDIYEPTKVALETFLPRIPKGGIIAFDELNSDQWPGETVAALETVGISNLRLERFPFDAAVSFAVIE